MIFKDFRLTTQPVPFSLAPMQGKIIGADNIARAMGVCVSTLHWHRKRFGLQGIVWLEGGQLASTEAKCRRWRKHWNRSKNRGRPLRSAGQ